MIIFRFFAFGTCSAGHMGETKQAAVSKHMILPCRKLAQRQPAVSITRTGNAAHSTTFSRIEHTSTQHTGQAQWQRTWGGEQRGRALGGPALASAGACPQSTRRCTCKCAWHRQTRLPQMRRPVTRAKLAYHGMLQEPSACHQSPPSHSHSTSLRVMRACSSGDKRPFSTAVL
jgi:hypothetical protein